MRWVFFAIGLLLALPAHAQFNNCSQTVGTAAAPVPFAAGTLPRHYLEICNGHATNTLAVNPTGGTAAVGAQGSRTLTAGQCWAWTQATGVPQVVSVIGSAATTTTACQYN